MIQANRVGTMEGGCCWPGNGRTWVFMEQLEGTHSVGELLGLAENILGMSARVLQLAWRMPRPHRLKARVLCALASAGVARLVFIDSHVISHDHIHRRCPHGISW